MSPKTIRADIDKHNWRPRSAVWELTLACNLRCGHCGSRAGRSLPDELTTAECLDLVTQLSELGCELITLSGGEPTLRDDWDRVALAIHQKGMFVNMVTNGVYTKAGSAGSVARRALDAGMCNVGVSIDGPRAIHDKIRGAGAFEKTAGSIRAFREAGLSTTIMTTINRLNLAHLEEIRAVAMELGARALRFQLAKPMGTMDDHREWVLRPGEILTLLPRLAAMKQQGGVDIRVGDSLGYYGKPDKILRARSWRHKKTRWGGCQAGMQAIGIQANGDIKGCLSLQAARGDADPFVEGNVRDTPLFDIWYREGAFAYNRDLTLDQLTHDCKTCRQAAVCRGGARCISSAVDGTLTHDDYCYYRLLSEQEQNLWSTVGRSAAAAAFAVTMNSAGCAVTSDYGIDPNFSDSDTGGDSETATGTSASETDVDTATESTGDTESGGDTSVLEYGIEPDYAVEPPDTNTGESDPDSSADTDTGDTDSGTGIDTGVLEYGIEPDYGVAPEYAVEPDTDTEGADPDGGVDTDTRDTDSITEVDTDAMDYGVDPDYGVAPEYGVEPMDTDTGPTPRDTELLPQPDYGVELDYGLIPDE